MRDRFEDESPVRSPVPAALFVLLALVAVLLIAGALTLAFSGYQSVQTGVQARRLRDTLAQIPPLPGARRLHTAGAAGDGGRCSAALYIEVYAASADPEAVAAHYAREFRSRGWVEARGGHYPAEALRVDFQQLSTIGGTGAPPSLTSVAGLSLPPDVQNALRAPGVTGYALVIAGWDADQCPERNL